MRHIYVIDEPLTPGSHACLLHHHSYCAAPPLSGKIGSLRSCCPWLASRDEEGGGQLPASVHRVIGAQPHATFPTIKPPAPPRTPTTPLESDLLTPLALQIQAHVDSSRVRRRILGISQDPDGSAQGKDRGGGGAEAGRRRERNGMDRPRGKLPHPNSLSSHGLPLPFVGFRLLSLALPHTPLSPLQCISSPVGPDDDDDVAYPAPPGCRRGVCDASRARSGRRRDACQWDRSEPN